MKNSSIFLMDRSQNWGFGVSFRHVLRATAKDEQSPDSSFAPIATDDARKWPRTMMEKIETRNMWSGGFPFHNVDFYRSDETFYSFVIN